jgi:hypothetical protein
VERWPLVEPGGGNDTELLQMLLAEVSRTRAELQTLRGRTGVSAEATTGARRACLQALEEYAGALDARCWPVPRAIHQDIQLHRALCENATYPRVK